MTVKTFAASECRAGFARKWSADTETSACREGAVWGGDTSFYMSVWRSGQSIGADVVVRCASSRNRSLITLVHS